MNQVPIEDLLKQCSSIYKLVVVSVKRAKELAEGSPKLVQTPAKKITSVALEEVRQGKVMYKGSDEESDKPGKKRKEHKEKAAAKSKH